VKDPDGLQVRSVPSLDTIRRLIIEGQLSGDHQLAKAADGPWQRLGDIEQLKASLRMAKSGESKAAQPQDSPPESEAGGKAVAEGESEPVPVPAVLSELAATPEPETTPIPDNSDEDPQTEPVEECAGSSDDVSSSEAGLSDVTVPTAKGGQPVEPAPQPQAAPQPEASPPSTQPPAQVAKKEGGSPIAILSILAAVAAIVVFLLFYFEVI